MSAKEVLRLTRQLIDGEWHSVHVSLDGRVSVDTGLDDQRPDHDGVLFHRPRCVCQMIGSMVYDYVQMCGCCGGELVPLAAYCQHCGKGVAHYTFSMGVETMQHPFSSKED